jgi:hypothetical protein
MVWRALDESERAQWNLDPLESVGPLRFGLTHAAVKEALEETMIVSHGVRRSGDVEVRAQFSLRDAKPLSPSATLSVYYDDDGLLACVAINARNGPQVFLDGLPLVGRVPSELEDRFVGQLEARDEEVSFNQYADPSSQALGIVLRAQRVDDVVLSRPVFVSCAWARRCGDSSEGSVPEAEWHTY